MAKNKHLTFDERNEKEIRYVQSVTCVTNRDSLTVSERTIYRLIDSMIISAMNNDLF